MVIYATSYHPPKLEFTCRGDLTEADAQHLQRSPRELGKRLISPTAYQLLVAAFTE